LIVRNRVRRRQCLRGPRTFLRKTDDEERDYRQHQNNREEHSDRRGECACFATCDRDAFARCAFHRRCGKPARPFVTLKKDQRREREDREYHRLSHRDHVIAALARPEDLERQHPHVTTEEEWRTERSHRRHERQQRSGQKRRGELLTFMTSMASFSAPL